jgi:tripartite-type tricarboxylate transporter receptor subunit TctC
MNPARLLLLLALAASLPAAQAQSGKWPTKPVRVIVPTAAAGTSDFITRIFASRLTEEYGQQFIVDNRPGAGGSLGNEIAARAAPDGYTITFVPSSYAATAALYKLAFDPVKGIAPIGLIQVVPFLLVVHPSVKAGNLKEFVELTRAQSGTLNFGSPGTGSTPHLAGELFQQLTGGKWVHVPYKGDAPAVADLITGQVHINIATQVVLDAHIKVGRIRALAVTTEQRSRTMPELPAIGEMVPGFDVPGWSGVWAPGGTSSEIVTRLNQSLGRILKQPDVIEKLRAIGAEPTHSTPEGFAQLVARDVAMWTNVVKTANIKLQ